MQTSEHSTFVFLEAKEDLASHAAPRRRNETSNEPANASDEGKGHRDLMRDRHHGKCHC